MNTIEFYDKIVNGKGIEVDYPVITNDDVRKFYELLQVNDSIKLAADKTESSVAFYTAFPDIKKLIGAPIASEVFYAYKLGFIYSGVPNKLVYILYKAFKETDMKYPNLILWKAFKDVKSFVDRVYVSDKGKFTFKTILENVYGSSANIISSTTYKCLNNDVYEIFIESEDRIALVPKDIGDCLSEEDCRAITYDPALGLVLNETPIRRLNGRLGITFDDFDLREVI